MPILDRRALDFYSHSPEQTVRFGARLGELLRPGDTLTLSGSLGAGKTTFMSGVARGWGYAGQVTSPTFVLVNDYARPDGDHLYHVDAYRLERGADAQAFGLDDLLAGENVVVVEWPERIADALPLDRLSLALRWEDHTRRGLKFEAQGPRYETLMDEFRHAAFGN
jgi:tRNA threonylcarbamoyladenosine biosynthesis protein TsaE